MQKKQSVRVLSLFTLAMLNVAAVVSLRNLPIMAEYGWAMIFFYAFACVFFFIPCALVAAELATGWPETGGVYAWVREAFGPKWGFLAAWLLWVTNAVYIPALLTFIAGTIAYVVDPNAVEQMLNNRTYVLSMVLSLLWVFTFLNLRGMKISGFISSFGAIIGTLIPGAIIIGMGLYWAISGKDLAIAFEPRALLPDLTEASGLAFLAGTLLGFAGIELSAVHAREAKNPQRDYPRAILIATLTILIVYVLGSLAVAFTVPKAEIGLIDGVLQAFSYMFSNTFGSAGPLITRIMAGFIVIGALATFSTWLLGPVKSLLATSRSGDLPPVFQSINKNDMPSGLMIAQGFVVSLLCAVFVLVPSIKVAFWLLVVLAAQLYIFVYALMFLSVIKLRIEQPEVYRSYKIPGGMFGVCLVGGVGLLGCLFTFIVGFFPPEVMAIDNVYVFESLLIGGLILLSVPPLVIYRFS